MIDLPAPYRQATKADAPALADLVDFAGEGLPAYLWARMAEPGESVRDVGIRRAQREEGAFSYRNAIVGDADSVGGEGAIAALIGYAEPDAPEPIDADTPPMFVPLQELENLTPSTWYINVLATYPEHRNRGHGARLIAIAEQIARASNLKGMSLIVSDANHGAIRLYERLGYHRAATRPMVKEEWKNPGQNWVLLVKMFAATPGSA